MTRLATELSALLDRAPASARPLREVVARLPQLLSAECACAYLVRRREAGFWLDFFHGAQMPAGFRGACEQWLQTAPKSFDSYDPARPDARQRNRPLRLREVERLTARRHPPMQRFLARFALSECDQLRVLVCDGPQLLAWVGAFRAGRFSANDAQQLARIVPSLQRRLALERRMGEAQQRAGEIAAALDHVPAALFVLGRSGAVLHANEAGRVMLDRGLDAQPSTAVALDGSGELRLAIVEARVDPGPRVTAARARWRLTPRQADVLRLVGEGMSNRAVARALRCAESTVELHVTAILGKSRSQSRAHLVARLWSGA